MALERYQWWILAGCCAVLTVLWLPGLRFPVVSDTAIYAEIGENLWKRGVYAAFSVRNPHHLPLHAFLSYPLVDAFGVHLGMKLSTLLAGFAVLLTSFLLLRRHLGTSVAIGTVVLLTIHHALVLMTMLGSADLLFAALFLGSLAAYSAAADHRRYYLLAGALAGLSCITRYNGLPLIPLLILWTVVVRPRDVRRPAFLVGSILSVVPMSGWFLRNFLVYGNPLHSDYTGELALNSRGPVAQVVSNFFYYAHPLHNILPLLLVLSLYAIYRHGNRQRFLVLGMLAAWLLTAIWWVQAMRFAFAGYPILLGLGVLGLFDLWNLAALRTRTRARYAIITASILLILFSHLPSLCVYSYGACNAWVDRHIGLFPANMGLTPEGFYAWDQARNRFNATAPQGSVMVVDDLLSERAWKTDVFRPDVRVISGVQPGYCPLYHITQRPQFGEAVIYETDVAPVTALTLIQCP
ncbi:hypothetical protein EXS70_05070 [Candidatus Peribacteria bacterium]|nr:hypothetical protein [Candidatus Peribacteria bacterium]